MPEFDIFGGDRLAVRPFQTLADMNRIGLGVIANFVARAEIGEDRAIRVVFAKAALEHFMTEVAKRPQREQVQGI